MTGKMLATTYFERVGKVQPPSSTEDIVKKFLEDFKHRESRDELIAKSRRLFPSIDLAPIVERVWPPSEQSSDAPAKKPWGKHHLVWRQMTFAERTQFCCERVTDYSYAQIAWMVSTDKNVIGTFCRNHGIRKSRAVQATSPTAEETAKSETGGKVVVCEPCEERAAPGQEPDASEMIAYACDMGLAIEATPAHEQAQKRLWDKIPAKEKKAYIRDGLKDGCTLAELAKYVGSTEMELRDFCKKQPLA